MKSVLIALVCALCGCQRNEQIEVIIPAGFTGLINVSEDRAMSQKSLIIVDQKGFGRMKSRRQTKNWTVYTVFSGDKKIPSGATSEGQEFGFHLIGGDENMTYYYVGSYRDRIGLEKDSPQSLQIQK